MYQTYGKYGKYRTPQYVNTGVQNSAIFTTVTAKIDNFPKNKFDIVSHLCSKQSIMQNYVIVQQRRTHSEDVDIA